MHTMTRTLRGALVLSGLLASAPALATNGYVPHGVGTANKAMAGAGMALPEDTIAIVLNPASAALLDEQMGVGVSAFMPRRNYTTLFGGLNGRNQAFSFDNVNIDSGEELFLSPEIAGIHRLQDGYSLAWALYMRNGLATSYKGGGATFDPDGEGPLGIASLPGTFGDGNAEFELSQILIDVGLASTLGDRTAFGVSAVLAAQSLEAKGFGGLAKYTESFAASSGAVQPEHLSGNGKDTRYGFGLKAGLHRQIGAQFSLAASYQSRVFMGEHSDYADLLAGNGDLDIPARAQLGVTWQPNERFSFSIDAQYIWYSDVEALGNSFNHIYDCPGAGLGGANVKRCLGGADGAGFGWDDMPVMSLGGHWDLNDDWRLRAGFSFGDQPTAYYENTFNIPLISLAEAHYTFGFSHRLGNGDELGFSFMYTEEESLEELNQLDPSQVVRITTDQFDFQVSYRWGLN
ncbi:MAG: outer membrane protein transport protein [Lysobacterales bacterium]|jgi:long-chain fatty acid transport protein